MSRRLGVACGWLMAIASGCAGQLSYDPLQSVTGTGGSPASTGGTPAVVAGTGGQTPGTGGQNAGTGGQTPGSGGQSNGTGGTATAGAPGPDAGRSTGGAPATGGATAAGGAAATGGAIGSAGPTATGGVTGSGGTVAAGGATGTGGAVGAGGNGGGAPVAACPSDFNVLDAVFKQKCGGCHGATSPTKNLDLVSTGLGARVVNKPSTCSSRPLLTGTLSGGKASGHLLDKLLGDVMGCGVRMPPSGALSATELACVNEWAVQAVQKQTGGAAP